MPVRKSNLETLKKQSDMGLRCCFSGLIVEATIVVPTKNDSDVIFCLQLLSKTLTCIHHLSERESINHLRIGLIHK